MQIRYEEINKSVKVYLDDYKLNDGFMDKCTELANELDKEVSVYDKDNDMVAFINLANRNKEIKSNEHLNKIECNKINRGNANMNNIKQLSIQEKYYKALGVIAKYNDMSEVEKLSESERLLYDMSGLNIMSVMVAFKLQDLYKYNHEADQIIESLNKIVLLIDDNSMKLAKYFSCLNETMNACNTIVLSKSNCRYERLLASIQDDEGFKELCELVYNLQNSNNKVEDMNIF